MPGPTQPGFYSQPLQGMKGNPPPGSEDDYYGPPTPEMRKPPLDVLPKDLWGAGPRMDTIDLTLPPGPSDPGAMEARQYSRPAGKWFVDQVEDGIARVEDPDGNAMTMRAQPGWKEGMHIDPPGKPPRKRLAVP